MFVVCDNVSMWVEEMGYAVCVMTDLCLCLRLKMKQIRD